VNILLTSTEQLIILTALPYSVWMAYTLVSVFQQGSGWFSMLIKRACPPQAGCSLARSRITLRHKSDTWTSPLWRRGLTTHTGHRSLIDHDCTILSAETQ
jgi:hypothetical protein